MGSRWGKEVDCSFLGESFSKLAVFCVACKKFFALLRAVIVILRIIEWINFYDTVSEIRKFNCNIVIFGGSIFIQGICNFNLIKDVFFIL